jgi:hypothetical protein
MKAIVRLSILLALVLVAAALYAASALAWEQGPGCNSGRGNGSEGSSSQLITPSTGSVGTAPTVDCDPGNSGAVNHGGD